MFWIRFRLPPKLMRKHLFVFATAAFLAQQGWAENPSFSDGVKERAETISYLRKIADPVLENLSLGKLKNKLPLESSKRQLFAPLEAFGRTMAGIAPWLELGPDASEEGQLRSRYIKLAREGIRNAVDHNSSDRMTFAPDDQPVVDAAFLALALLRAPHQLWDGLDPKVQANLISALKMTRSTRIGDNNWQCFSAVTEVAIWKFTGECDMNAIERAVSNHQKWYLGDGVYGDGPHFHWDYYNSYVIQPMLLEILSVCRDKGNPLGDLYPEFLRRAQRYSQELERLISPEATFPVMGRSSTYRFGAFQDLSLMALMHQLPKNLKPGSVRSALTSVIRRVLAQPGTFDQEGWIQPGSVGSQPQLRESYISRGSPYLCTTGLLQLGLPASDPFWTDPSAPWTQQRIWSGESEIPIDHFLDEKVKVTGEAK